MITIFTTVFNDYHKFLNEWIEAASSSNPDHILIISDKKLSVDVEVIVAEKKPPFTEAFFRQIAGKNINDGWIWQIDVDDRILPDALTVLDNRKCDVVQVGYMINNCKDNFYIPDPMTNAEYLSMKYNPYATCSPFTKDIYERVGGFPYMGYSDWGFWRECARAGARFEFSEQICYNYRQELKKTLTGIKSSKREKYSLKARKIR